MTRVVDITSLANWREPKIGEDVYLPTSLYLSRGRDDFIGGLCQISRIIDRRNDDSEILDINRFMVETVERPYHQYNWYFLIKDEKKNIERYGDKRGRPDPDYDPRFNEI